MISKFDLFLSVFLEPLLPETCSDAFEIDALFHWRDLSNYPMTGVAHLHIHQGTLLASVSPVA